MSNTFEKFAVRKFGPNAATALEVSDRLRDTSAQLPAFTNEDIAHFNAWTEENVANGPLTRGRTFAKRIVAEWSAALGEPSNAEKAARTWSIMDQLRDNPDSAVANLTSGLSGNSTGGLLGDLGEDTSLSGRIQAATKKRDDLAKKHGEDSTEFTAASLEVDKLVNLSEARRVFALAVALTGEGVSVPDTFTAPLSNLPTGGTTLDDLQ